MFPACEYVATKIVEKYTDICRCTSSGSFGFSIK